MGPVTEVKGAILRAIEVSVKKNPNMQRRILRESHDVRYGRSCRRSTQIDVETHAKKTTQLIYNYASLHITAHDKFVTCATLFFDRSPIPITQVSTVQSCTRSYT